MSNTYGTHLFICNTYILVDLSQCGYNIGYIVAIRIHSRSTHELFETVTQFRN